ncbi:MAG: monovalent cation:proton antiporter-2 (CPA2) family protein [Gammaproteobacteria bacterium]|nr:monovalent cation:proton antiporter-2 (CPA2) family protein [Gammaproteobacteria bacterium]
MSTFLESTALLLLAAVIAVPLSRAIGLGAVIGYLAAGIILGPHVTAFFVDGEAILHFAEFGVVLLLFIIGLELQPSRLWVLRKSLLGQGLSQVAVTSLLIALLAGLFIGPWTATIIVGGALALSSTAFVLQLLAERKELPHEHGRAAFSILLFQDIAVIPMLVLIPLLAGKSDTSYVDMLVEAARVTAILLLVVVGGRYLLRHFLRLIHNAGVREISTAAALLLVLGISLLMHKLGLSMALGAFIAGVLLADSEFRHQLEADIEPFKGLLLGLFFMSVGMTANLDLLLAEPLLILLLALGLIATKAAILFAIGKVSGLANKSAVRLALVLSQGGEFAFVILSTAIGHSLIPVELADRLILVVTVSMMSTPLLYGLYSSWVEPRMEVSSQPVYDTPDQGEVPVVIAGFGRFGQMSGRLLRTLDVPFTALDISPDQVDVVRRFGNPVHYGDAGRLDLLDAAHVDKAAVFILAVDEMEASLRIARAVRHEYPHVRILARARNRKHAHLLMDLGVHWLVRETQLSALAMAEELLVQLGRPADEARRMVATFRQHDDEILQRQQAVHHDQQKVIQSAKEAADELRTLLESDRASVKKSVRDAMRDKDD